MITKIIRALFIIQGVFMIVLAIPPLALVLMLLTDTKGGGSTWELIGWVAIYFLLGITGCIILFGIWAFRSAKASITPSQRLNLIDFLLVPFGTVAAIIGFWERNRRGGYQSAGGYRRGSRASASMLTCAPWIPPLFSCAQNSRSAKRSRKYDCMTEREQVVLQYESDGV